VTSRRRGPEDEDEDDDAPEADAGERIVTVGALPEHGPPTVDWGPPTSALAVGAHPDDVEFGCGATLATWAARGCRIHHLVLTDGSKGTWEESGDGAALMAARKEEQREAARRLGGGDVEFLDLVDGELGSGLPERREVVRVIRRLRPDAVLGHDPWRRYRLHPDHRHAGWLVVDGVVAAREPTAFPDLGPPHRPRALFLWEADEPNHVERAENGERKVEALLAHRSQYRSTLGVEVRESGLVGVDELRRRIEAQLAEHGAVAGVPRGEAFRLITDL
jgi:LmbE family N-acetylglucosaminyl deacetylase